MQRARILSGSRGRLAALESLRIREAAELAHVSTNALRRWLRLGLIPAVKTRAGWRVRVMDLDRFLGGAATERAP
jgi:excisionase family DNA binding protein